MKFKWINIIVSFFFFWLQQLSLDTQGSSENTSAIPAVSNLEMLFTKFQEMIKIETAKTNTVKK